MTFYLKEFYTLSEFPRKIKIYMWTNITKINKECQTQIATINTVTNTRSMPLGLYYIDISSTGRYKAILLQCEVVNLMSYDMRPLRPVDDDW